MNSRRSGRHRDIQRIRRDSRTGWYSARGVAQNLRVLSLFCCPVKPKTYLCQKSASKKAATKYGRSLRALCLKKTGVYNIDKLFGHFSTSLRNDFRAVWQARCELDFEQ